ncbi:UDP-2,4-diacetamido-2,4,6-trideoxy-beta-L-altropyranose hydrolase [Hymenobacter koreensis]|uniref:UDP-2,4-diacetamido-2,4,6-trideoxy-beta-L-altropyranose hydrolase n=1 Tax=Hymenobacter koreensis TaxID=1084523 RepID=A0ABP8JBQ0_9BACT
MLPRLVLRADGNAQIGLGHVVRLLALAEMVKAEFEAFAFVIRDPTPIVAQLITDAGFELLAIKGPTGLPEAAMLASGYLHSNDVAVLDGYHFDSRYQETVRSSGCRVVVVDDVLAAPIVADLIINHAPGISPEHYKTVLPTTRFCLGPAFSLLRAPFRTHAHLPSIVEHINSVVVCFGGADPQQLTVRCLEALAKSAVIQRISVVLGGAFMHDTALQRLIAQQPSVQISVVRNLPAPAMVELLQAHDAVICPASTVLLETLVLGCAAITGYYVENQQHLADYVHTYRQAYSVGNFTELDSKKLEQQLLEGLAFHQTNLRQPYVARLAPDALRREFRRLLA